MKHKISKEPGKISANDVQKKFVDLISGLSKAPGILEITKTLKQIRAFESEVAGLKPLKVAIVSSFTFDVLVEPLVLRGYGDGFKLSIYNAPFGQYIQEMIVPSSEMNKFEPDVIFLAVRLQDVCPKLYHSFNSLDESTLKAIIERWKNEWLSAISRLREINSAIILCTNYEQPPYPSLGIADIRSNPSQCRTINLLNQWLEGLATQISNFYVMDVDALAARCGRNLWTDPKMWFWARSVIASCFVWDYVGEITRMLRAIFGLTRKVLALDCDNTLWGGILGEVGPQAIALGHDFPGNAYVSFQKRILELYNRGIVLVIASKNEHSAVMDVFENHPEMVLRPTHIAYFGVNWDPKPENLRKAAEVLNLDINSFVFMDDNPVECDMVRKFLPGVLSVCLPDDPSESEMTLAKMHCFDQLVISAEDRKRGGMYRMEASRAELKRSVVNLETFYHQLEMKVLISQNDKMNVSRVAQLTQRTNQFNMTTIRRTESQIEKLISDSLYYVYTLRLLDRFGDNGIVGVAIVKHEDEQDVIETFIMSCRVLGRTVENAFLSWVANQSLWRGISKIVALYRSTPKNKQFAEFYRSWGMCSGEKDLVEDTEQWCFALTSDATELQIPPWINIKKVSSEGGKSFGPE